MLANRSQFSVGIRIRAQVPLCLVSLPHQLAAVGDGNSSGTCRASLAIDARLS